MSWLSESISEKRKKLFESIKTPDNIINPVKPEEGRVILNIPEDGSYIEILGHKLTGDFNSFESFVEYLKKVAEVEMENEKLKKEIREMSNNRIALMAYLEERLEESKIFSTYGGQVDFVSIQERIYEDILNKVKGE